MGVAINSLKSWLTGGVKMSPALACDRWVRIFLRQGLLILFDVFSGTSRFWVRQAGLRLLAQLRILIQFLFEILNDERVLVDGFSLWRRGLCRHRTACGQETCDYRGSAGYSHLRLDQTSSSNVTLILDASATHIAQYRGSFLRRILPVSGHCYHLLNSFLDRVSDSVPHRTLQFFVIDLNF